MWIVAVICCLFFFFNDTATTEIYTLSLHDALPIWPGSWRCSMADPRGFLKYDREVAERRPVEERVRDWNEVYPDATCTSAADRKSTRLNSSHANISYAVFCLKKKKTTLYWNISPHI